MQSPAERKRKRNRGRMEGGWNGTRPNEGERKKTEISDAHGLFTSGEASSQCVRTKSANAAWTGSGRNKKRVKTMRQERREKRKKTNGDVHLIILKRVHGNSGVHRRLILNKTEEGSMERVVAGRPGCVRDKADAAEAVKETEDVRHLTHCRVRRNVRHKKCRRRCRGVDPADQRDLVELGFLLLWEC